MYELKRLAPEAVSSALQRAKDYRLLKEPYEAESICLDVLAVDPENQDALITLILAITEKFGLELNPAYARAMEVLDRLNSSYCRHYYSGIIFERRGKVHLQRDDPGSGRVAFEWLTKAMDAYGRAMASCDPDNQDAVLRWNTCARILNENDSVRPADDDGGEQLLDSYD